MTTLRHKLLFSLCMLGLVSQASAQTGLTLNAPSSSENRVRLPAGGSEGVASRPANEPQAADRIVVVINDEVITLQELRARLDSAISQLKRQNTPLPQRDVLEKQMLERMVTDKVQLQYARETGLRVEDAQLEAALQRIAETNKMSLAQFLSLIHISEPTRPY